MTFSQFNTITKRVSKPQYNTITIGGKGKGGVQLLSMSTVRFPVWNIIHPIVNHAYKYMILGVHWSLRVFIISLPYHKNIIVTVIYLLITHVLYKQSGKLPDLQFGHHDSEDSKVSTIRWPMSYNVSLLSNWVCCVVSIVWQLSRLMGLRSLMEINILISKVRLHLCCELYSKMSKY